LILTLKISIIFLILFVFSGCCITHIPKSIIGIDSPTLKNTKQKFSFNTTGDINKIFNTVYNWLDEQELLIYRKNIKKYFICARRFDKMFPNIISTTDVSVYFSLASNDSVNIDVVSFNNELAQFVCDAIKNLFNQPIESKEEENL
jgi:hypothetical protein